MAALHLDGLGPGAHGERQVDAGDLVDVEPDARLLGDAEARELGAHRVDAGGQERERVVAARIRRARARQARQVAVNGDARSRHHRAGRILDGAGDLARGRLCPGRICHREQGKHGTQQQRSFSHHHPPNARLQTPHLGVSAQGDRPERQDSWRCEAHFRAWGWRGSSAFDWASRIPSRGTPRGGRGSQLTACKQWVCMSLASTNFHAWYAGSRAFRSI